jgi:hypothetical protein
VSFRDCGIEDIALGVGSVSELINKEVVEEVKRIDPAQVSLFKRKPLRIDIDSFCPKGIVRV